MALDGINVYLLLPVVLNINFCYAVEMKKIPVLMISCSSLETYNLLTKFQSVFRIVMRVEDLYADIDKGKMVILVLLWIFQRHLTAWYSQLKC